MIEIRQLNEPTRTCRRAHPTSKSWEFGLDEINCNVEIKFRLPERKQPMTQLSQPLQRANAKLMTIVPLRLQVSDIVGSRDSKSLTLRQFLGIVYVCFTWQTPKSSYGRGWKLVGSRKLRRKGLSGASEKKRSKLEAYCNVVAGDLLRTGACKGVQELKKSAWGWIWPWCHVWNQFQKESKSKTP